MVSQRQLAAVAAGRRGAGLIALLALSLLSVFHSTMKSPPAALPPPPPPPCIVDVLPLRRDALLTGDISPEACQAGVEAALQAALGVSPDDTIDDTVLTAAMLVAARVAASLPAVSPEAGAARRLTLIDDSDFQWCIRWCNWDDARRRDVQPAVAAARAAAVAEAVRGADHPHFLV